MAHSAKFQESTSGHGHVYSKAIMPLTLIRGCHTCYFPLSLASKYVANTMRTNNKLSQQEFHILPRPRLFEQWDLHTTNSKKPQPNPTHIPWHAWCGPRTKWHVPSCIAPKHTLQSRLGYWIPLASISNPVWLYMGHPMIRVWLCMSHPTIKVLVIVYGWVCLALLIFSLSKLPPRWHGSSIAPPLLLAPVLMYVVGLLLPYYCYCVCCCPLLFPHCSLFLLSVGLVLIGNYVGANLFEWNVMKVRWK
jgi:hypothetical protein